MPAHHTPASQILGSASLLGHGSIGGQADHRTPLGPVLRCVLRGRAPGGLVLRSVLVIPELARTGRMQELAAVRVETQERVSTSVRSPGQITRSSRFRRHKAKEPVEREHWSTMLPVRVPTATHTHSNTLPKCPACTQYPDAHFAIHHYMIVARRYQHLFMTEAV